MEWSRVKSNQKVKSLLLVRATVPAFQNSVVCPWSGLLPGKRCSSSVPSMNDNGNSPSKCTVPYRTVPIMTAFFVRRNYRTNPGQPILQPNMAAQSSATQRNTTQHSATQHNTTLVTIRFMLLFVSSTHTQTDTHAACSNAAPVVGCDCFRG